MIFDPAAIALGAAIGLVGCTIGFAVGFAAMWWLHRRQMREYDAAEDFDRSGEIDAVAAAGSRGG